MTAFCIWTTAVRLLAEVFGVPTQNCKCKKRDQFSLDQENVLGCRLLIVLRLRLRGASTTPYSLALKDAQTEWGGLYWDFWVTRNMYSYECHCTFPFRYFCSLFITTLSGVGIPVGARFSVLVQTDLGAHPTYRTLGTGSLSGGGGKFAAPWELNTHPHLAPRLKKA
jgi:hypothetical protein